MHRTSCVQHLPQQAPSAKELSLGCTGSNAGALGNLLMGVALHVVQHEDRARAGRQPRDGPFQIQVSTGMALAGSLEPLRLAGAQETAAPAKRRPPVTQDVFVRAW